MNGYRIKKFKKVRSINYVVGYTQLVRFNENDIDIYKRKFNELKKSGTIIKGEFEDTKWVLKRTKVKFSV